MNDTDAKVIQETINRLNSHPNVLCSNIDLSNIDYKQLLKEDSHEYYLFAFQQYTIKPLPGNVLNDVLSSKGVELFNSIVQKVKDRAFKDSFLTYEVCMDRSGNWFAAESSPWYGKSEYWEDGILGAFVTWNNNFINGNSEKQGAICTSTCIFIVEPTETEDGWCYTKSGSLYKLKFS